MTEARLGRREAAGLGLALAASLLATGCTEVVQVHGNMPDPEVVGEIEPGRHNRNDVAQMIGSPSTVSTFEDHKWYYIGQKTRQVAFYKPEVLERSVLVVTFDDRGQVDDTLIYTLADGKAIQPVERITETEGEDFTVLQQLLGNLGRFSGDQSPTAPGQRAPDL